MIYHNRQALSGLSLSPTVDDQYPTPALVASAHQPLLLSPIMVVFHVLSADLRWSLPRDWTIFWLSVVQLQPLEVARIGRVVAAIAIIGARPPTKYQLTYAFSPGTNSDAKSAVARAFSTWASNTQFTFSESPNHEIADLKIGFYRGDHGDGAPFNGANGILAHAFAPTDGRFHFNEDHSFSMEPVAGLFHLETVALHEIGHLLGLAHSQVQDTIMFPGIAAGTTKGLNADDIQGLKTLYDLEA
ncbi:hypothetical protein RHGRI_000782 [Rhododendron griersonianum]|uniref:Peptidase metallopeptidase domain-containing protein n=1 Tax=Rhododendron griersonianum TaxID=479676 RepID=A0AAV6LHW8_9ERIC|nr:hypothetical protein RHGRI_000782 [Rhododendron griersonianum]